VSWEDTLLAGAIVEFLCKIGAARINDAARIARDCFERHGRTLEDALAVGTGGARLHQLGYDDDIRAAARVDAFALVPELRHDPLRIEIAASAP
jgi:phosphosulfolactate phosphohydrolase-like enzyme